MQEQWTPGRIRERLDALAEPKYRDFSAALIPGETGLLGVRLPLLRTFAGEIAAGDWREYLDGARDDSFEERMLQGMVIGCADMGLMERLGRIAGFVPKVDNWSICDSFCAGIGAAKQNRGSFWEFLQPYLSATAEFEVRFGAVMLLDHFLTDEWIGRVLPALEHTCRDGFYAHMGVAWALSGCYVKFPRQTLRLLLPGVLEERTRQKALQKIIESRRITPEQREEIRRMKQETG